MKTKFFIIMLLLFLFLTACSTAEPASTNTAVGPLTLTVMVHDSFAVSDDVIAAFEQANNVKVQFLASGDAGSAVNKAALSKEAPLADVFYGVDNTFLSRALDEGIFEPYNSPLLEKIPAQFKLDPLNQALPVDFGDVCLNYDVSYFSEKNLTPPANLEDLLKPAYRGLLVVENPATSSPGLAFLFATIGHFGEAGYLDFWQGLVDQNVKVVNDWETAYYTDFSRWGGQYPLVVSYGSSPPFEMIFAEEPLEAPPTVAITTDGSCFRQIEFVGILKGTQNHDLAEKFVDFMLSPTFQEDIPLQMYVFPVNPEAQLDETFVQYLSIPENPIVLDPAEIAKYREDWIQAWTDLVLR
ncbi:MAG TPA: thiamine ABC transporter substrate-binding protein [Chloroflexi bacterium]|nr:thiamine ABC transporter substrate-binding protein [Chloroflexota bacterium]